MYRFLREPTSLAEFDFDCEISIWCENRTLICLCEHACDRFLEHCVYAKIHQGDTYQECAIYGSSFGDYDSSDDDTITGEDDTVIDANIAETATFFWSLKVSEESDTCLEIDDSDESCISEFRFTAFAPEQLARILDSNPMRHLELRTGVWSAEQSIVLATRPYPLSLKLCNSGTYYRSIKFEDNGTAFANTLWKRQFFFGSLSLVFQNRRNAPLSLENLERLLQFDNMMFEKLQIDEVDLNIVLLPLSTKTRALDYKVDSDRVVPGDFDTVDIVTSDLDFKIYMEIENEAWDGLLISFLNRVRQLGHFERLGFSLWSFDEDMDFQIERLVPVVDALVGAIRANPKLVCLNLSDDPNCLLDWVPHLQPVFEVMEDHPGIHMVIVRNFVSDDDKLERANHPAYLWLEQLLSRNRNIKVLDPSDKRIDKLYALNRFCNGSVRLIEECPSRRASLMATSLVESASGNYQRTALLLSNHVDLLWEFIDDLNLEEPVVSQVEETELPASNPRDAKKVRTS